jgi:hypothetical protein
LRQAIEWRAAGCVHESNVCASIITRTAIPRAQSIYARLERLSAREALTSEA